MHAEGGVPAGRIRHLNRGYRRAVVAKIVRTVADPGTPSFHLMSETHALQLPHAVRRQEYPCSDFSERRCLLIDGNMEAMGDQRIRGEQSANSASNDHDGKLRLRHRPTQKMLRKLARSSYPSLLQTPSADSSVWTEQWQREEFGMRGPTPALLPARHKLAVLTLFLALIAYDRTPALAGDYPDRPVKIVVPFPAGGTADAIPRIVADWLSRKWSQPVVIENRTGAAGNIGADQVYHSTPDGYTLLSSAPPPLVINHNLYPRLGFDPTKFEPVIVMAHVPNALIVNPYNIKA